MAWDFATEPEFEAKLEWMRAFVREEIMPLETLAERWRSTRAAAFKPITAPLKDEVKRQGLWAAHLPPEHGRHGLRPGEARPDARDPRASARTRPAIFGNNAPDSGNAELIAVGGTDEQKEQWMQPLLDGKIRSVLLDDRARRRRRPDAAHHHGRARRRRVGHQRAQVVLVERLDQPTS